MDTIRNINSLALEKKKRKSILDIKPEHFGCQYRNLSEDIDDVLFSEDAG